MVRFPSLYERGLLGKSILSMESRDPTVLSPTNNIDKCFVSLSFLYLSRSLYLALSISLSLSRYLYVFLCLFQHQLLDSCPGLRCRRALGVPMRHER